jgi:hypothetical protein
MSYAYAAQRYPAGGIPAGASFDVLFGNAVDDGSGKVASVADGINGRVWTGALDGGTKWTRDTTEKSPRSVAFNSSTAVASCNVEYKDAGGDTLASSFSNITSFSFMTHAKMTTPNGNSRYLFGMGTTANNFGSFYTHFSWNGTNWRLNFTVGAGGSIQSDLGAGNSTTPPFSGWNSWGVTCAAGTLLLYQNGVALTTLNSVSVTTGETAALTRSLISMSPSNVFTSQVWVGYIGRSTGYTRPLSATEMLAWHTDTVTVV